MTMIKVISSPKANDSYPYTGGGYSVQHEGEIIYSEDGAIGRKRAYALYNVINYVNICDVGTVKHPHARASERRARDAIAKLRGVTLIPKVKALVLDCENYLELARIENHD